MAAFVLSGLVLGLAGGLVPPASSQDGIGKATFSPCCRAHVRHVRFARKQQLRPSGGRQQFDRGHQGDSQQLTRTVWTL